MKDWPIGKLVITIAYETPFVAKIDYTQFTKG